MKTLIWLTLAGALAHAAPGDPWRRLPNGSGVWRGAPIQYKILDGWALVEGDILLAPVAELQPDAAAGKAGRESSGMRQQFRLWPKNVIPYTIDPALPNPERVRDAIKHWEERTPIRFVERTNEGDWVTFRRNSSGCSSNVGLKGREQFVNLASDCDTDATIHEIGHAVGLWHTQSRTDRDRWVRIRYESIDKDWWSQFDRQITNGRDIGPYPFNSVMHYSAYAASRDGAQVMVSVPPGIPIGQAGGLTPLDVYAVHQLYGLPMEKVILSTTPSGLTVKVDGAEYKTPAEFNWQAGETHTLSAGAMQTVEGRAGVRYDFAGWSDDGAAEHTVTITDDLKVFDARYRRMVRVEAAASAAEGAGGGQAVLVPKSEDGFYPAGTRVRLSAIPAEGNSFLSWCGESGDIPLVLEIYLKGCSVEETDVDVDVPVQLAARFTSKPVTVIASEPPGRLVMADTKVFIAPIRFAWEPGTEHELRAIRFDVSLDGRSYYELQQWSEGEGGSAITVKGGAEPRTITAAYSAFHEFSAGFDWYLSAGSTLPNSLGMATNPPDETGYFRDGTEVEITPPENDRWKFANWYRDLTGSGTPARIKVSGYTAVVGNFLGYGWMNAGAITHDAKRQPDIVAPGQRVRLYWMGITPDEPAEAPAGAPLPTVLAGVEVKVNRVSAPLVRVSKDEIVFVVPDSAWTDDRVAGINVVTGRTGNLLVELAVLKTNPGVYTVDETGTGPAIDRVLRPGEEFEISATGLRADEAVEAIFGQAAEPATAAADEARPGVWRVRTRVPREALNGGMPFYLLSGGKISQPGVRVEVGK
jgi:astacin